MVTPHQWLPDPFRKCWTSVTLSFWPHGSQHISKIYVDNSFKWRKAFFSVQAQGSVNKTRVRCFIFSHMALCGPPLPIVFISSPLHRASLRLSPPGWRVIYKALLLARDIRQHQRLDFRTICKICFGSLANSGSGTRKNTGLKSSATSKFFIKPLFRGLKLSCKLNLNCKLFPLGSAHWPKNRRNYLLKFI